MISTKEGIDVSSFIQFSATLLSFSQLDKVKYLINKLFDSFTKRTIACIQDILPLLFAPTRIVCFSPKSSVQFFNLQKIRICIFEILIVFLFSKILDSLLLFQRTNQQLSILLGYDIAVQALNYYLAFIGCMNHAVLAFILSDDALTYAAVI